MKRTIDAKKRIIFVPLVIISGGKIYEDSTAAINDALVAYGCNHQRIDRGRMMCTIIDKLLDAVISQFSIIHANKATPRNGTIKGSLINIDNIGITKPRIT